MHAWQENDLLTHSWIENTPTSDSQWTEGHREQKEGTVTGRGETGVVLVIFFQKWRYFFARGLRGSLIFLKKECSRTSAHVFSKKTRGGLFWNGAHRISLRGSDNGFSAENSPNPGLPQGSCLPYSEGDFITRRRKFVPTRDRTHNLRGAAGLPWPTGPTSFGTSNKYNCK